MRIARRADGADRRADGRGWGAIPGTATVAPAVLLVSESDLAAGASAAAPYFGIPGSALIAPAQTLYVMAPAARLAEDDPLEEYCDGDDRATEDDETEDETELDDEEDDADDNVVLVGDVDLDGDGIPDGTTIDEDGDGLADGVDLDGDGEDDGFWIDTDGDGIPDTIGFDTDGDGVIDSNEDPNEDKDEDDDDENSDDSDDDDDDSETNPNNPNTEEDNTDESDDDDDDESDDDDEDHGGGDDDDDDVDGGGGGGDDDHDDEDEEDDEEEDDDDEEEDDDDDEELISADLEAVDLDQDDVDSILGYLILRGHDDVAYWLSLEKVKLRKFQNDSWSDRQFTDNVRLTRDDDGNLVSIDFLEHRNVSPGSCADDLAVLAAAGDVREFNKFESNYLLNNFDEYAPTPGPSQANREWAQKVLREGPGVMAGAAFQFAFAFLPVGKAVAIAGKVVWGIGQQGFSIVAKSGPKYGRVLATGGQELSESTLGSLVKQGSKAAESALKATESEIADWVGRFCFTPDTPVHIERGLVPIGEVRGGDRVWSYRFEVGDWVLSRVATQSTATYHGTLTRLRTAHGVVESTGSHPYWVVRGERLIDRPKCLSLVEGEDSCRTLDGRWVGAQDLRAGDVAFGRDGRQHQVVDVQSREAMAEVCTLSIEGHANFAVGEDGILAHNDTCWRDLVFQATGRTAGTLEQLGRKALVHGHHIVMKTIPNDVRGYWVKGSQDLLEKYGLSVLKTKDEVRMIMAVAQANGRRAEVPNLCYAANGFDEIHSEKYVASVYQRLFAAKREGEIVARQLGATEAQTAGIIATRLKSALNVMAGTMELGAKFW